MAAHHASLSVYRMLVNSESWTREMKTPRAGGAAGALVVAVAAPAGGEKVDFPPMYRTWGGLG